MWNKIEQIMKNKNINANQLSNLIGFKNNSTIYSLKNGSIKNPSFELMERIADTLDVSLDEFRDK
ncbi:helix-turn-helix domain-containing protein [Pediococcus inopinatus]|uniref:helix-turn-helix domain-containing protein n=1 Tax=Pediococcus inopinatus TaxID=114090 RepID=UPI002B2566F9|nr:helix-turn-helix transcriptional regulator [Pediococcus inopinatus]WPC19478.1 helix-turn-helix domain-containing protein [Pediococcus inopinatus]